MEIPHDSCQKNALGIDAMAGEGRERLIRTAYVR
jgi:hypothetical protein